MAQYNPPSQNLPIFDSGLFGGTNQTSGGVPSGDFLNFPNAQGDENLLGITVADSATFNADSTFNDVVEINNDTTFSTNIIMSGTYLTNYIEFPDGTQQFSANGSGTGDALLAGGTSTNPQNFTGYNEFSNADGQITLTSTTNDYSINLSSSTVNSKQLIVGGELAVGNNTNSKLVGISADINNSQQLNIDSSILISGAGYPMLLAGYSGSGIYGLRVSGGGIFVGNNGGAVDSSYFVQIACSEGGDGTLVVSGDLNITGTTITLNGATFTAGTTGLTINTSVTLDGNLTLQGTVGSTSTSSILSQSSTLAETVQYDGNIQTFGGSPNRSIYLNYSGQSDLQIQQNYDEFLEVSTGLTLFPNKYTYPGSTNFVNMEADGTTNNQLNIAGNLLTSGNIILGSGSTPAAYLKFGNGSVQTVAYTGGAPILTTYTSSTLDTLLVPYVWSFTGISNSLGNQVSWILYSNSAMATSGSSTVFSDTNFVVEPSGLSNYIYGSGTAIQIPYKFDDGTTTTTQHAYYPSTIVALGGFTLNAIANSNGTTTFKVTLSSDTNTNFTNGSTLKLVIYAN